VVLGAPVGLNGGRGASEQEDGAGLGGEMLGEGAGVIAGIAVLFVGALVLLVEDDQAAYRSAGASAEWRTATSPGKRAVNRRTTWEARAISGTRTIADRA